MIKLQGTIRGVHQLSPRYGRGSCAVLFVAFLILVASCAGGTRAEETEHAAWRVELAKCISMTGTAPETASGRALPRFVGLRFRTVNLRQGPDRDHRINWVYLRKGMPLLVIAEHHNWRRVCDMDGIIGWIHRSQLTAAMNVMVMGEHTSLHAVHSFRSRVIAQAEEGALLRMERCFEDWCLVGRGALMGWVPRADLWGVLPE